MNIPRLFLARSLLALAFFAGPAAYPAAAAPVVIAEGFSISRLFSGLNNRTRIVQFCAGAMALGLFIMMKKLAPDATSWSVTRSTENQAKLPKDPKRS